MSMGGVLVVVVVMMARVAVMASAAMFAASMPRARLMVRTGATMREMLLVKVLSNEDDVGDDVH